MSLKTLFYLLILLVLFQPDANGIETYEKAVANAQQNAANPWGWIADDLITVGVSDSPAALTHGLRYDADGRLVVRTLSKARYYSTQMVGKAYSVYGSKESFGSWVTTGNDLTHYIDRQIPDAATLVSDMEKGLGMDTDNSHDAIFEMGVRVGDGKNQSFLRPTRNPDSTTLDLSPVNNGTNSAFPSDADAAGLWNKKLFDNFKAAYADWLGQAYTTSKFPWTQFGYTYKWGSQDPSSLSSIKGMSEFVLLGGAGHHDPTKTPSGQDESGNIIALGIYSPQSYLYTKNNGSQLSQDAGAQYGNGFASFHITGPCDSIWAGSAFQAKTRTTPGEPNTIRIGPGALISDGQGILVWSQNYTLTNHGTILGPTMEKFNISGTNDIAVLFKGEDNAMIGGTNRLENFGIISSPGTAVQSEAGDTEILLNGGSITAKDHAILTGPGNDRLVINGGRISGDIDLGTGHNTITINLPGEINGIINLKDTGLAFNLADTGSGQLSGTGPVDLSEKSILITTTLTKAGRHRIIETAETGIPTDRLTTAKTMVTINENSAALDYSYSFTRADGSAAPPGSNASSLDLSAVADQQGIGAAVLGAGAGSDMTKTLVSLINTPTGVASEMASGLGRLSTGKELSHAVKELDGAAALSTSTQLTLNAIGTSASAMLKAILEDKSKDPDKGVDKTRKKKLSSWTGFATGYGGMGNQENDGGTMGYDIVQAGWVAGTRYKVSETFNAGGLLGYAYNRSDLDHGLGRTTDHMVRMGGFASLEAHNHLYSDLIATLGIHDLETQRNLTFLNTSCKGDRIGYDVSVLWNTGHRFEPGKGFALSPEYSLAYTALHDPSYAETGGASGSNLQVGGGTTQSLVQSIGIRSEYSFSGDRGLKTELTLGWEHEYLDTGKSTLFSLAEIPIQGWRSDLSVIDPDRAIIGFRVTGPVRDDLQLFVRCNTRLWSHGYHMDTSAGILFSF